MMIVAEDNSSLRTAVSAGNVSSCLLDGGTTCVLAHALVPVLTRARYQNAAVATCFVVPLL